MDYAYVPKKEYCENALEANSAVLFFDDKCSGIDVLSDAINTLTGHSLSVGQPGNGDELVNLKEMLKTFVTAFAILTHLRIDNGVLVNSYRESVDLCKQHDDIVLAAGRLERPRQLITGARND